MRLHPSYWLRMRVNSIMGHAEEDSRGCDESSWFVRLVSSLVRSDPRYSNWGPSAVLAVAPPPTGLFAHAAGGPHSMLWYICNGMIGGPLHSIGIVEGIVADGLVAEAHLQRCHVIFMG